MAQRVKSLSCKCEAVSSNLRSPCTATYGSVCSLYQHSYGEMRGRDRKSLGACGIAYLTCTIQQQQINSANQAESQDQYLRLHPWPPHGTCVSVHHPTTTVNNNKNQPTRQTQKPWAQLPPLLGITWSAFSFLPPWFLVPTHSPPSLCIQTGCSSSSELAC